MELEFDDFFDAYKKFKTEIYYNTVNLHQRKMIAEFEAFEKPGDMMSTLFSIFSISEESKNFACQKLLDLHQKFSEINPLESTTYFESLLNEITCVKLPKSVNQIAGENGNGGSEISKIKCFISMPIELHVIEVLWAMKIGVELEKNLTDHVVGNRLLKTAQGTIKRNGALFVPYFRQYKKWRDGAIKAAIENHEKGNNVSLLNLDIKDCYHSIRLKSSDIGAALPEVLKETNLNTLYFQIMNKYTQVLREMGLISIEEGRFILPIGLLSSNIICNWYLSRIDNAILKDLTPVYYSRYVDDISIVFVDRSFDRSTHSDSEQIDKLLGDVFIDNLGERSFVQDLNIRINSEKKKLFHYDNRESNGALKKYLKEMTRHSSESRIATDESSLNDSLLDSIYSFSTSEDLNKLNGLKDITATKFGVSVYLTRAIQAAKIGIFVDDNQVKELTLLVTGKDIVEYSTLWEKIFTLLVFTNKGDAFIDLYEAILNKIVNLRFSSDTSSEADDVKRDLFDYLLISIQLATNLDFPFMRRNRKRFEIVSNMAFVHEIFRTRYLQPFDISNYNKYTPIFAKSNMLRHTYLRDPLMSYVKESRYNVSLIAKPKSLSEPLELDPIAFALSPRRVKLYEIMLFLLKNRLMSGALNNDILSKESNFITESMEYYFICNHKINSHALFKSQEGFNPKEYIDNEYYAATLERLNILSGGADSDSGFGKILNMEACIREVKIDGERIKNPRIGLANMIIPESSIESSIKKYLPERQTNLNSVMKVMEQGRKSKCNFIVFPECAIDFMDIDLISELACIQECAVIFGTEHLNLDPYVYNFVVCLLPVEINGSKDLIPVIRLKNHYSHRERDLIEGFGYKIPEATQNLYHQFIWRNLYFSVYYCFELADISHRSLFKSKVDMIFTPEWNKDTQYFSNITEAACRDIHAYFIQVNTSQYGDSRLTKPSKSDRMDLIKIKGGKEALMLSEMVDIDSLRNFQLKQYNLQKESPDLFKPVPPNFSVENVKIRIRNESYLKIE